MELTISLQAKQRQAIQQSEETPIVFFGGAKGGGKSYTVRAREILRRMKYPGTKGLIIRKTYQELLDNHIHMFFKEYPETQKWYNSGEKKIYWPGGSTTQFSYLQNTNDVYTYQGREYEDITVDEVTQHEWEVIRILKTSLRTTNSSIKPRMFLTGNPGGIGHDEVKRIFIDRAFNEDENPSDYAFVQAFVADNQALTENDPDYIKRLEDLPERLRKAYLEGNWEISDDKAFKMFSARKHVLHSFTPIGFGIILSMDWGISSNAKFAAYLTAKIPMKLKTGEVFNRLITFKEWSGNEKKPDEWAEIIYTDCKRMGITPDKGYPDAAMLDRTQDGSMSIGKQFEKKWNELNNNKHWLTLTRTEKHRAARVALTFNWLSIAPDGLPYAMFTESCTYAIQSIPKLRWDDTKLDDIDTTGDDHGWDGWSYGIIQVKFIGLKAGAYSYGQVDKAKKLYNSNDQELAPSPNLFALQYKK